MTRWEMATIEQRCRGNHSPFRPRFIRKGEWLAVITVSTLKRRFIRCQECAGPPPAELVDPSPAATVQDTRESEKVQAE